MAQKMTAEKKAALILVGFALIEGAIVLQGFLSAPEKFLAYMGFAEGRHGALLGWLLALAVTAAFVAFSYRLPSVRENLIRLSWLKLLALPMALFAGILEEWVFRAMLMNHMASQGAGMGMQILFSGFLFGLAHGIWGLFGKSLRGAVGPIIVTGVLGSALAVVYIVSGRLLLPAIAAHLLIDALIEPGLVLAACRREFRALRSIPAGE